MSILTLVAAGKVTHVQVAVGGRWEEAARVGASAGLGSLGDLTRSLPLRGESAVEVFSQDACRCLAFIGVRFVDRARHEMAGVLRELCEVAFSEEGSLLRVASWLSENAGARLFETEYSVVEVGVVDAWKSVGAVRLAPTPDGDVPAAEAALLDAAGRLSAPPNRVIAVEFARSTPVPHWVAVEVGRSSTNGEIVPSASRRIAARCLAELRGS